MQAIKLTLFKIDFSVISKSLVKSVFWLIVTAIYGTAPLLLLRFANYFSPHAEQIHKIKELLNELTIPFLSSAMIAEIGVEAFLCKIKFSKYAYAGFLASSLLILALSSVIYTVFIKSKSEGNFNFDNLWIFQGIVVTYTIIYCLSIKTIMFIEEDKIYKKCQP